jgi:aquaporin NIP
MKKYASEFMGTFALVFCGTGAIVINQESHGVIGHAGVAITFGLIVMVMIYALGEISGAHMNPAVTVAFTLAGRFSGRSVLPYILAQFAGAAAASAVLKLMFPWNESLGATIPAGSVWQSAALEFILTFFLMLVILSVSSGGKERGLFAGIAVGSTVLLEAMFAGPVSGASMNPARSFAPAVMTLNMDTLWIYLLFTTAGAALAVPVWNYLQHNK